MLGRSVAAALDSVPPESLVSDEVVAVAREADVFMLNLECCISDRGEPWPDPAKPFFFRAPPRAVETLVHLGVDGVTLANNHALDYGPDALLDTIELLSDAGILAVGAGMDVAAARAPILLERGGFRLAVFAVSDHPADFAAGDRRPGIAFADLRRAVPGWLVSSLGAAEADAVLLSPHWGPNMTARPVAHVRQAAAELSAAGATLIAGHSGHVFHGVQGSVAYDLGDFLDDYRVDPDLRNDLGLIFLVALDEHGPARLEGVPLKLEFCRTRLADGAEAAWIRERFTRACAELGSDVAVEDGRLIVTFT